MNITHFVAATIGQKSTPKKRTALSAEQIDFFRRRYQRRRRKQILKKKPHLSNRTTIQTTTQMETNKTLPPSQKRPKLNTGGDLGNETTEHAWPGFVGTGQPW